MSSGALATVGYSSYLMVEREKTFKTYNVSTTSKPLAFTSAKFHMEKDSKTLEEITTKRTFANRVGLGRKLDGEVSFYMASDSDACQYLLQNAMGGGVSGTYITSATATGDTVGAAVFDHVYSVGNFDVTYSSLSFNHRKGDSTNGKIWAYQGFRVDSFALKAKLDDSLMATVKMIGCDATVGAADLSGSISNTNAQTPLDFVGMAFYVDGTLNSITAASFWHVQSIDFGMSNKLKADASSRAIGSDVVEVLQPGINSQTLKVQMRFDDLTAYNAMLAQTQMACQLKFMGATIAGSVLQQMIKIDMPKVFIKSAGDPEVGGPNDVLKANVEFEILRDVSTTTGYAFQVTVRNKTASY